MTDLYHQIASLTPHALTDFRNHNPFIMEGIVLDTNDPNQMGRIKVWIPSIDGELYDKDELPWCEYASPLAGTTNNFRAGRQALTTEGPVSYGFWAIPKISSIVLVFFLNGDANRRFFFGSYHGLHGNRSLPDGRNVNPTTKEKGVWSDTYDPVRPAMDNLKQQFSNNLTAPEALSRGVFERQAAQDKTEKDGTEGYALNTVDETVLDSQTYCWVTPGHHAFIMQDTPENCRLRIKTCEGNQIILDDTNERIYISTARGGAWLEFDEDGHIHFFAKESFSIRAGKDVNIIADNNINIEAGKDVNIKAVAGKMSVASKSALTLQSTGDNVYVTACSELHGIGKKGTFVDGKTINLTSEGGTFLTNSSFDLKTSGKAILQGKPCIVNGGVARKAEAAKCGNDPANPAIVPSHEPWKRPKSKIARNKYWKE